MQYTISDRAADKLRDLLRRHESGAGGASSGGGPRSLVFVQCTSATAIGGNTLLAQCYPAKVLAPACDTALPPEVEENGAVLLTLLTTAGESATPTLDGVYLCVVSGDVESDGSGSGSGRVSGRPRCFGTEAVGAASPASPIAGTIPVLDSAGNLGNTAIQYSDDPVNGDPASQYRQYTQDTPTGTSIPQFLQQVATNGNGAGTPTITQQALPSGSVANAVYVQTFTPSLVQQAYTLNGAATLTQTVTESGGVYTFAAAGATLAYTGTYDFSGATVSGVGTATATRLPIWTASGTLESSEIVYAAGRLDLRTVSPDFTTLGDVTSVYVDPLSNAIHVYGTAGYPAVNIGSEPSGTLGGAGSASKAGQTGTYAGLQFQSGWLTGGTFAITAGDVPDLSATYQPLDADLDALAALAGTNDIYYRSAANTWTAVVIGAGLTFAAGTLDSVSGGGDALTTNPLSQFAATTSSQLRGVLSDETGTGLAYFQGGDLGTPSAGVLTNSTGTASGLTAGTATALATSRTINGTSFDGSANITVTAAASTLTGATLASGVTASSLTSFGASIALGTPASVVLTNATGLPVAGGGSGRAVTVAYAPICGGTTTTAAQQSVASVGTSGQILTSAGAGALPTFANPVTGTNGQAALAADFTISAASGTAQATGLSVTLPSAGTYLVTANVCAQLAGSTGTSWFIQSKLRNTTDSADVANTENVIVFTGTTAQSFLATGTVAVLITVTASKTIEVYATRNGTGTPVFTASIINGSTTARSRLSYVKVAN